VIAQQTLMKLEKPLRGIVEAFMEKYSDRAMIKEKNLFQSQDIVRGNLPSFCQRFEFKTAQVISNLTEDEKLWSELENIIEPWQNPEGGKTIENQGKNWQFVEQLSDTISLEMVYIPAGTFLMGLSESELKDIGAPDESSSVLGLNDGWNWVGARPKHTVTLREFFIGRYTVTQAQYQVITGENPSCYQGKPDSPNRPVEEVSWHDAVTFCQKLGKKTGKPYRLPSEAEWEYACRGGTTTSFHFGQMVTPKLMNFDNFCRWSNGVPEEYGITNQTIAVGSLGYANAFGLYDMHGNVWEWCEDVLHQNYNDAPGDGRAWINGGYPDLRVVRGGCWYNQSWSCSSTARRGDEADSRDRLIGFRVAFSL
jgi:eukaryotic-like serine/threonine-protein kinase